MAAARLGNGEVMKVVARRTEGRQRLALLLSCGLLVATFGATATATAVPAASETVLFVCEHGSAKSLLAAELFNREAARRHLRLRAIARGTTPEGAPQSATLAGLATDGIDVAAYHPQQLLATDVASARAVVSFDVDLTPFNPTQRPVSHWDRMPPVSEDYQRAKNAILQKLDDLLRQLRSGKAAR